MSRHTLLVHAGADRGSHVRCGVIHRLSHRKLRDGEHSIAGGLHRVDVEHAGARPARQRRSDRPPSPAAYSFEHYFADFVAMLDRLEVERVLVVAISATTLPYVHNLFEHLACSDLALVQGGLSTCMELVATRRPFLSFPLERHFEQCIHVQNRLHNYCADCAVRVKDLSSDELAERALRAMHQPIDYKPVETDGAARAAKEILAVMENRHWAAA